MLEGGSRYSSKWTYRSNSFYNGSFCVAMFSQYILNFNRNPAWLIIHDLLVIRSLSKPRRRSHQTKGFMNRTMVLHMRFKSLYRFFAVLCKTTIKMTKSYVFLRTCTALAYFSCLPLELNAVIVYLAWASCLCDTEQIYTVSIFDDEI